MFLKLANILDRILGIVDNITDSVGGGGDGGDGFSDGT